MIIKIYKCFFKKIIKLYSHNLENKIIGYMRFFAQIYQNAILQNVIRNFKRKDLFFKIMKKKIG